MDPLVQAVLFLCLGALVALSGAVFGAVLTLKVAEKGEKATVLPGFESPKPPNRVVSALKRAVTKSQPTPEDEKLLQEWFEGGEEG